MFESELLGLRESETGERAKNQLNRVQNKTGNNKNKGKKSKTAKEVKGSRQTSHFNAISTTLRCCCYCFLRCI